MLLKVPNDLKIGDYAYPVDNSFAMNKNSTIVEFVYLAATSWNKSKQVKIVSEPYQEIISDFPFKDNPKQYEFVDVEHEGSIYRVLNTFVSEAREMVVLDDDDDAIYFPDINS